MSRGASQDAVALCFCEGAAQRIATCCSPLSDSRVVATGCSLCQELNEVDLRAIAAAQQQVSGEAGVTYVVAPVQPKM